MALLMSIQTLPSFQTSSVHSLYDVYIYICIWWIWMIRTTIAQRAQRNRKKFGHRKIQRNTSEISSGVVDSRLRIVSALCLNRSVIKSFASAVTISFGSDVFI